MSRRVMLLAALAAAAASIVLVAPVQGARHHRPHRVIRVGDDYFAPAHLTGRHAVRVGTLITWRWSAANTEYHNVKLTRSPARVRHFRSPGAATDYHFNKIMRKAGVYRYVCTFHRNVMRGVIRVKR